MKIPLFDGPVTVAQQVIIGLWSAALFGVVALWGVTSAPMLANGTSSALLSIGSLLGLLATYFALTQFMLMGRIDWIESAFGLDKLAGYHRFNGYAAIILILAHSPFIVASYALRSNTNYVEQYVQIVQTLPYVNLAAIAVVLFVGVVFSSMYIARKRLKFETWYYVHLAVYIAIVFASLHQFAIGSTLLSNDIARGFWLSLYLFVAFNVLMWRFYLPLYNFFKHQFTVDRIVKETPTTTSVYIRAKHLSTFKTTPGQFILVRFLSKQFVFQEHPFSLSMMPKDNMLRVTIRNVGDYTEQIKSLRPGTKVVIAGPFGRFTNVVAKKEKKLYIAGGVGITPLRAMFEESVERSTNATLLFSNKDTSDVPLKAELDALAKKRNATVSYVYSTEKVRNAEYGRIDGAMVKRLVKDVKDRDVYVCGPPAMMEAVVSDLKKIGVPSEQVHVEQFALHA